LVDDAMPGERAPGASLTTAREVFINWCPERRLTFGGVRNLSAVRRERRFFAQVGPTAIIAVCEIDDNSAVGVDRGRLSPARLVQENDTMAPNLVSAGICSTEKNCDRNSHAHAVSPVRRW
jgi:hypothetical protein